MRPDHPTRSKRTTSLMLCSLLALLASWCYLAFFDVRRPSVMPYERAVEALRVGGLGDQQRDIALRASKGL